MSDYYDKSGASLHALEEQFRPLKIAPVLPGLLERKRSMLENINSKNILCLDIETVPVVQNYDELSETLQRLWDRKSLHMQKGELTGRDVYEKAGIFAEFGRIICISVGTLSSTDGVPQLRIKSFCQPDEKELLEAFAELLNGHYNTDRHMLCAHNGKEFDFPYTARRMVINRVKLPRLLDIAGKKPWEVRHLDTMELWKFGDYKHYTSLELLTHIMGIPTPKDDITGADVARVYWQENGLGRIVKYCEKDVVAVAQLLLRFQNTPLLEDDNITCIAQPEN